MTRKNVSLDDIELADLVWVALFQEATLPDHIRLVFKTHFHNVVGCYVKTSRFALGHDVEEALISLAC